MNFEINTTDSKKQLEDFKKEPAELGKVINPIPDNFELNKQEILEVCQIGEYVCKINSAIRIIDKPQPPSPDFIIEYNKKPIRLEHAQILTKNASWFFKVKSLLDYAERIFKQKYSNINVHATISVLGGQWDYKQKDKPKLAEQIADFIQWARLGLEFELSEKITQIKTTKHSKVSFLYDEKNRQSEYLTRERLRQEVSKKENKKIKGYQKNEKNLTEL